MKKIWETGVILFAMMGFWGMIYPDFCFTRDICKIVCEKSEAAEDEEENVPESAATDMFTLLCEAQPGQIRIKSKLLDELGIESRGKMNAINER